MQSIHMYSTDTQEMKEAAISYTNYSITRPLLPNVEFRQAYTCACMHVCVCVCVCACVTYLCVRFHPPFKRYIYNYREKCIYTKKEL